MNSVIDLVDLGFPWEGLDPFIFTVHHLDRYPAGNEWLGPDDTLEGRYIGSDFSYLNGWSMYHGDVVPGFPQHPHRGFETVTVVRRGYVDHHDSLGATGRYGGGDVQWLTTGSGLMHSEMFPLLEDDDENTLELFQIWLNLPPQSKMVPGHFGMLWSETIPKATPAPGVEVDLIAGTLGDHLAPPAPPNSWASQPGSALEIWLIRVAAGSRWTLPRTIPAANRMLHCFIGDDVSVGKVSVSEKTGARLDPESEVVVEAKGGPAEFLLLGGMPIGAPVFQLGPFVMNSAEELRQAVDDYNRTQFGGWPWPRRDPVHDRSRGRFAIHADGRVEEREMQPAG